MLSRAHLLKVYTQTYTLNRPVASCLSRQGLTSASSPLLSFPSQPGKPGTEYKVNTVLSFSLSWSSSTLCHPYPDSPLGPLASLSCFCSAGCLRRQKDSSNPGRLYWSRAARLIYKTKTRGLLSNGNQSGMVSHQQCEYHTIQIKMLAGLEYNSPELMSRLFN